MTETSAASTPASNAFSALVQWSIDLMSRVPYWLVALITRISIAGVFWQSGRTKMDGWRVSDLAIELCRSEYRLPVIDPLIAAYLAAFAEHVFPVMLVVGIATRFGATALLVMTLVIQIFVYPDAWPTHGTWAACFLILMTRGPGIVSLDHLIARRHAKIRSEG
jgi:putative oxidoreductase